MTAPPSFTCPTCGATSYHPDDVRHGYCGHCHAFTGRGVRYGYDGSVYGDDPTVGEPRIWFDYNGDPVSFERWSYLINKKAGWVEVDAWRVGNTVVLTGLDAATGYEVDTQWMGTDAGYPFHGGVPMIYETMVFWTVDGQRVLDDPEAIRSGFVREALTRQYADRDAARAGHFEVVDQLRRLLAVAGDLQEPADGG